MREIKFRGKSDLFGWVYGSFASIDGSCHIFEKEDLTEDGHHIRQDSDRPTWVDENTIGQYTGLKDVNGKEIYEGDIIAYDKYPYKHLIYYDDAEACFMAKYGPGKDDSCRVYQEWINICHKQVIGNIHDNPELIELWDIYQVVRHQLWKDNPNPNKSHITVDSSPATQVGSEPLIKIESKEE